MPVTTLPNTCRIVIFCRGEVADVMGVRPGDEVSLDAPMEVMWQPRGTNRLFHFGPIILALTIQTINAQQIVLGIATASIKKCK